MTRETGERRGGGRANGDVPPDGGSSDLVKRLRHLEHRVPPDELDELWIFPPLEDTEGTREFLLFTRRADRETRRVYSARVEGGTEANGTARSDVPAATGGTGDTSSGGNGDAPSAGNGSAASPTTPSVNGHGPDGRGGSGIQSIVEHGRVPAERLPRIVERFLRRLGEERAPVHVELDGSPDRWGELLADVAPEGPAGEN